MNWDDTGFLISKNRYNENSLISEFYTKNHGKISGIVFGGTSKKIKNYLQIGNQLYLNYNSKSENKPGVAVHQEWIPLAKASLAQKSMFTQTINRKKVRSNLTD